jgi:PqqD family protein of HPr-rel-A system
MRGYIRTEGVLIESLGHRWAAFSPTTGETTLLNDESAAILELLESGTSGIVEICSTLAEDSGIDSAELFEIVQACWPGLIEAGLVREACPAGPIDQ